MFTKEDCSKSLQIENRSSSCQGSTRLVLCCSPMPYIMVKWNWIFLSRTICIKISNVSSSWIWQCMYFLFGLHRDYFSHRSYQLRISSNLQGGTIGGFIEECQEETGNVYIWQRTAQIQFTIGSFFLQCGTESVAFHTEYGLQCRGYEDWRLKLIFHAEGLK